MTLHFHKDLILEELMRLKPRNVLDAGFAGGIGIEYYSKNMPDVVFEGSDRNPENVANFKARNNKLKVIVADANKLPFSDNEYDVVISDALIICSKNDSKAMSRELQRVARKHIVFMEQHNEIREGYAYNFENLFPGIKFLKKIEKWGDPLWDQYGWLMRWDKNESHDIIK